MDQIRNDHLAEKVGLGMWDKGRLGDSFRACL